MIECGERGCGKGCMSTVSAEKCGASYAGYMNESRVVLVNDAQTRLFNIEVGLRQGCLLSPILFALYINSLGKKLNVPR